MKEKSLVSFKIKLLLVFGIVIIILAICAHLITNKIIRFYVEKNSIIKENSSSYELWLDPPADAFRKYYIFDVQNPLEVQNGIEKPRVIERGPYTYRQNLKKKNIKFLGVELVSFVPVLTLTFEPSLSNGLETDNITFLNIPAVSIIEKLRKSNNPNIDIIANIVLELAKIELFVTRTVDELIAGYEDPVLKVAKRFGIVNDSIFGLYSDNKNGTEWQTFTVMTGVDNVADVGRVVSWNGKEILDFWGTFQANLINGSYTAYSPYRTRDEKLYVFNSDICRSIQLTYLKDNVFKNIDVYDFHLSSNVFANSTLNPENTGFCEGPCLGNGVLNVSKCHDGSPNFISQPHFLNADKIFIDSIDGLNPVDDKHNFKLYFEPLTGKATGGNTRLQINFYVSKFDQVSIVKNINSFLMPVAWLDNVIEIFDDSLSKIGMASRITKLINIGVLILLASGVLMLISAMLVYFIQKSKSTKTLAAVDQIQNTIKHSESLEPNEIN